MKEWTDNGRNYSACEKDGHVNRIWDDYKNQDLNPNTRVLVVTLGGSGASSSKTDDGFEWFCEDYVHRTSLANGVKCISAYGSSLTSSERLSDNIIDLIHTIVNVTNRWPKVILVGKSMGGCKLQHALYKRNLKNYAIDTFFGVDSSCFVSKHWQDGEGLLFHHNVDTLQNFYQTIGDGGSGGSSQTGHVLAYTDQYSGNKNSEGEAGRTGTFSYSFDRFTSHTQIDVNESNFDFDTMQRVPGRMCNQVDHCSDANPIDRCENLRAGIYRYIVKKASE